MTSTHWKCKTCGKSYLTHPDMISCMYGHITSKKRTERLDVASKILAGSIVVQGVGEALMWADRLIKELDK